MKRRVLLAGIGSASIGVGAAFGSGAFTSIESDRDVNLNVQGDSSAQIIFRQGSGTGAARLLNTDRSNVVDIIEFSQTSLNEQSKTIFKNALEVENNTDDSGSTTGSDDLPVDFYIKEQGSTKVTVIKMCSISALMTTTVKRGQSYKTGTIRTQFSCRLLGILEQT